MPVIHTKSAEQKRAESEVECFRKARGPFVVAAESTRMPMVFTDAREIDHPIIFANDAFLRLSGYTREEILGQSFNFLMARGADKAAVAEIEAAFANASDGGLEISYRRKDGTLFCAAILISAVRNESGDIIEHFASFVDLTKQKDNLAQSTRMIDELNHRVKNTLATVQSIVRQALRNPADFEIIKESIEPRLFALSRSHDLLSRKHWEGAGLRDLVMEALEPFSVSNGRAERIVITGENILLSPKMTLALCIALHELATNAVKYGAFLNDAGSLVISWALEPSPEGEQLKFRWAEKDGPSVNPPSQRGFGTRVIERGLAHELGGTSTMEFLPTGVVCTICFPAPNGGLL